MRLRVPARSCTSSPRRHGRRWSAQLTIRVADLAAGHATISLRPYGNKANEGFVDDMSGPAPAFSDSGTATVTLRSGRNIDVVVTTGSKALAGSGGGKLTYDCSVVGESVEEASPGVTTLVPDPTLSTAFCSPLAKFQ